MKFSIIIPVYNVEKYIEKCLGSVANQTFTDFEVIIVNDGSLDNSQRIIDKFIANDKRFRTFYKNNGGQGSARNLGTKKARGDYIIFVDSDDYIERDLLRRVNDISEDYDVVRFFHQEIMDDGTILERSDAASKTLSLPDRFKFKLVDAPWLYAFKREFWLENEFDFISDRYHEDYGLIPLVLAKANSVTSIDFVGYNYVKRPMSTVTDPAKITKRIADIQWFFDWSKTNKDRMSIEQYNYYMCFMAGGLFSALELTNDQDSFNVVLRKIKHEKIYQYIIVDSLKCLLKYLIIRFALCFYIKIHLKLKPKVL